MNPLVNSIRRKKFTSGFVPAGTITPRNDFTVTPDLNSVFCLMVLLLEGIGSVTGMIITFIFLATICAESIALTYTESGEGEGTTKVCIDVERSLTESKGIPGPPGKQGPPGMPGPSSGGIVYTRWGSRTCAEGTELVYTGVTGANIYTDTGGGANYLCMPFNPEYDNSLRYAPGVQGYSHIYAAAYRHPLQGGEKHLTACSVCHSTNKSVVLMIPARASCPSGWTREYYGYLMTEIKGTTKSRYMYECIDKNMDTIEGIQSPHAHGMGFFHVEADCSRGLSCSPGKYSRDKELNCAVCSK